MQIKVTGIGAPYSANKGGRSWQERVINFVGKQGPKEKKLKDFEGQIWEDFKGFQTNDTLDVKVVKEGDFWNWKSASKVEGGNDNQAAPSVQGTAPTATAAKGNWETTEERRARQVYIIRQSSFTSALQFFTLRGEQPSFEQVLEVAGEIEKFVFGGQFGKVLSSELTATEKAVAAPKRGPGRPKAASPATEAIQ